MVITVVYSCCGILIIPFVKTYTHGQNIRYDNCIIALLFLVIGIANSIRVPADTLITAAGHFKETQGRAILEATINLLVSIVLIDSLGIVGILIGTITSFTYRSTDILIYTYKKILKKNMVICIKRIIRMLAVIVINFLIVFWFQFDLDIYNWSEWFRLAFLIGGISLSMTLIVNWIMEPREFKDIRQMCCRFIMKNK